MSRITWGAKAISEVIHALDAPPSSRRQSIDLAALASGLQLGDDGIWFARHWEPVSYPAHGGAACLAVEDRSFWFRHRNRCIVSLVRRFASNDLVLDIGGGNGFVAKGLNEAGIDCILVEPGINGALAAPARGIDPVICARLEEVGLPAGCIPAAGVFDVLEHIEDQTAALRRVHTLLCPGGQLFLTVPAYPALFSAEDRVAGHFRRYTTATLARALAGAGFRVAFVSYMFAPLPSLVFLLRTLPSRFGLRSDMNAERDATEHDPDGVAARLMDRRLAAEYMRIAAGVAFQSAQTALPSPSRTDGVVDPVKIGHGRRSHEPEVGWQGRGAVTEMADQDIVELLFPTHPVNPSTPAVSLVVAGIVLASQSVRQIGQVERRAIRCAGRSVCGRRGNRGQAGEQVRHEGIAIDHCYHTDVQCRQRGHGAQVRSEGRGVHEQ